MSAPATQEQLEYIELLRGGSRLSRPQLGDINTVEDASAAIESMQRNMLLRHETRAAIFAQLRDANMTKADLYAALEIESLSASSGASEYDGARAKRYLKAYIRRQSVPTEPVGLCGAFDSLESVCAETAPAPKEKQAPSPRRGRPASYPAEKPSVGEEALAKPARRRVGRPPVQSHDRIALMLAEEFGCAFRRVA